MIIWQCSYRDVEYYTDIVVRWFLGESQNPKTTEGQVRGEIKIEEYAKGLEEKLSKLENYLPSSALYGKVNKLWAIDSNIIEVPFGKRKH
jgi:hypothetical protein